MSQPSSFDFSKFDPSVLDLSHLHVGEQNRIRACQFTVHELTLLLRGQNPWTKSGKPEPLPATSEEEPTLEQLLPLMHADTRSTLLYGEMRQSQRDEIIKVYKERWKEGRELQRKKFLTELDEEAKALDLIRELRAQPDRAHLLPPADTSREALLRWYEEMQKPVRLVPFPGVIQDEYRAQRVEPFPDGDNDSYTVVKAEGDDEQKGIKPVHVKYTFMDVVGFSERDPESQAYIVQKLNELVRSAMKACCVVNKHIFLPTGDGMCIAFRGDDFDIHLKVALHLLEMVAEHNNQETVSKARNFELRIGLNQGSDIVVKDINGNENLAGGVINMASRIMGLADAGQIFAGEMVYADLHEWEQYRGKFLEFSANVKHGRTIKAFQFKSEGKKGLSNDSADGDVEYSGKIQPQSLREETNAGISATERKRRQGFKAKIKNAELIKVAAPEAESLLWEVLISLWMVNRDEGATAIEDYGLSILLESGEELEGIPVMDSETIVDVSDFRTLSDLFAARDIPLERAHPRVGVIRFRFKGHSTIASAEYVLRIKDIYGLIYKLKGTLPDSTN